MNEPRTIPEGGTAELTQPTVLLPTEPEPGDAPAGRRKMVVSGGLWSAASQLLPTVGVAMLGVVAARMLGADALGRQSLIAYCNAALAMTLTGGLTRACLRIMGTLQGAGETDQLHRFSRWTTRVHLFSGSLVFLVMVVSGIAYGQEQFSWALIGAVSIIDALIMGVAVRVLLREGWAPLAKVRIVVGLVGPPLGIVGVLVGAGIAGIFAGDAVAALLMLAVVYVRYRNVGLDVPSGAVTRRRTGIRPPQPIGRLWLLYSVSEGIAQVVTRRVEFVVLGVLSTDREIGMYSVAFMVVSLVAMVPNMVATAAMPLIAVADGAGTMDSATRHVKQALRLGVLISLPLTALVATCGPPAVMFVYGEQYAQAAHLVPLAALVLLVAVPAGLTEQYWSGQGRLRVVITCGLIAAVLDLGVAVGLVPIMHAWGAVIANVVGQATLAASLLWYTVRRTGSIGWQARTLFAMAGISVTAAGAAYGAATLVAMRLGTSTLPALLALGAAASLGTAVVLGGCLTMKVLTAADTEWLNPLLPGPAKKMIGLMTVR